MTTTPPPVDLLTSDAGRQRERVARWRRLQSTPRSDKELARSQMYGLRGVVLLALLVCLPNIAAHRAPQQLSALDLVPCVAACAQAQSLAGEFALRHAPLLPLIGCDRDERCECGFRVGEKEMEA